MKITEKREYEHTIGKQYDYCGKIITINSFHDMIEVGWCNPSSQGCRDTIGTLDVCSTECFFKHITSS